jgi:hypothetical protein
LGKVGTGRDASWLLEQEENRRGNDHRNKSQPGNSPNVKPRLARKNAYQCVQNQQWNYHKPLRSIA